VKRLRAVYLLVGGFALAGLGDLVRRESRSTVRWARPDRRYAAVRELFPRDARVGFVTDLGEGEAGASA
jgi:hypothetical protein